MSNGDYGSNSLCVRFQETPVKDPLPENKSQAMPAHSPSVAKAMPGGVELASKSGKSRYPKGMKSLPNPWRSRAKPHRRKKGLSRLMGE